MEIDQYENLIRRYLLGELAETDQTSFEQELLGDREKFDQVWAVENELIDQYVRGEMARAERQRFEGHYLASSLHRERVAIAELFFAEIDHQVRETVEAGEKELGLSWWRRFLDFMRRPQLAVAVAGSIILLQ